MKELLQIKDLYVNAGKKQILKGLNLTINKGEVHVIMGPNGAGKSTLANCIFNNPEYTKISGKIDFEGENINDLSTDKIAKKGIFMSFQSPEEIPGISCLNFLKTAKNKIQEKPVKIFEFKDTEHPYILADIAGMYMYGQKFEEGLNYLYRSINQLAMFPNRYWNSDYGLAGAANTFRLLLLMCPKNHMELYRKIYSYDYLYLTKLACTTNDEIFQQEAYVNRASIAMDSMARYIIPININPDLLYISDMYYAHYCNELATQISISSGWKYNMKSLTYYQHASIRPNDTGGYVDIEEKTYNEIVSAKHEQAKSIALLFYTGICAEDGKLTSRNIESLFKILQYECRYNYKETRKRVLNFKSYK